MEDYLWRYEFKWDPVGIYFNDFSNFFPAEKSDYSTFSFFISMHRILKKVEAEKDSLKLKNALRTCKSGWADFNKMMLFHSAIQWIVWIKYTDTFLLITDWVPWNIACLASVSVWFLSAKKAYFQIWVLKLTKRLEIQPTYGRHVTFLMR